MHTRTPLGLDEQHSPIIVTSSWGELRVVLLGPPLEYVVLYLSESLLRGLLLWTFVDGTINVQLHCSANCYLSSSSLITYNVTLHVRIFVRWHFPRIARWRPLCIVLCVHQMVTGRKRLEFSDILSALVMSDYNYCRCERSVDTLKLFCVMNVDEERKDEYAYCTRSMLSCCIRFVTDYCCQHRICLGMSQQLNASLMWNL